MKKLSCAEARQIDLVDYLASIGFHALKIQGDDHWYLSPFRNERTASFKVNRVMNVWYDHGSGEGGNIIDFAILYHRFTVSDFLRLLTEDTAHQGLSFHPLIPSARPPAAPLSAAGEKKKEDKSKIVLLKTGRLENSSLLDYLGTRCISPEVACRFCVEVDFLLYEKKQTAIGFRNELGGYELRAPYFKGGSSPKMFSFFNNFSDRVMVFEGFFNFLSYLTMQPERNLHTGNYLVLNSLSFLRKATETMDSHEHIHLLLDRGSMGEYCTAATIQRNPKCQDFSQLYKGHEDLNDWLREVKQQQAARQQHGKGRSIR